MKVIVDNNKVILKTSASTTRVIRVSEQGPKGNETFHVGPDQPVDGTTPYVWLQTGLGDGTGYSLWIYTP